MIAAGAQGGRVAAAVAVALAACGAGTERRPAVSATEPRDFTLDNGLAVRLEPIPGAAEVAVVVLYAVGAEHDPPARTGLAHLVEHVLVTAAAGGAPARSAEELAARYPAGANAQTGGRYTVVATVAPAGRLAEELADAAARMGDLRPDAALLARERGRVLAELGNMYGAPGLAAPNRARERLAPRRKGGVPAEVAAVDLDEVVTFWRRYYKPRNARLIVAGGFAPDAAEAEVRRRFGALPPGEPPPPAPTWTPGAAVAAGAGELCLAWTAPAPSDPVYAAFVLAATRLVTGAAARFAPLDEPEVLYACAPLGPGADPAAGERALRHRVAETLAGPLAAGDVARARRTFGFLLGTESVPAAARAQNPYGVAFGAGRRAQLELDGARLAAALEAVDEAAFDRARRALVGR